MHLFCFLHASFLLSWTVCCALTHELHVEMQHAVTNLSLLFSRILAKFASHVQEGQEDFEINEQDLTADELQAFKRAVTSGRLNNMVQIWTPWWNLPEAGTVQLSASGTHRVSVQDQENGTASGSNLPA